jgi:hypothetical protein
VVDLEEDEGDLEAVEDLVGEPRMRRKNGELDLFVLIGKYALRTCNFKGNPSLN